MITGMFHLRYFLENKWLRKIFYIRVWKIIPVYKHFPGHGGTQEDSHLAVAVTRKSAEELRGCDWLPYLRGDLSRCAVMVGHIAVPALTGDMTPASLSEILVNGTHGFKRIDKQTLNSIFEEGRHNEG